MQRFKVKIPNCPPLLLSEFYGEFRTSSRARTRATVDPATGAGPAVQPSPPTTQHRTSLAEIIKHQGESFDNRLPPLNYQKLLKNAHINL